MKNPRNAGRKPTGKIRVDISLRLSPEAAEFLTALDNRSGWIARLVEDVAAKEERIHANKTNTENNQQ
jgi:hypothetical protein